MMTRKDQLRNSTPLTVKVTILWWTLSYVGTGGNTAKKGGATRMFPIFRKFALHRSLIRKNCNSKNTKWLSKNYLLSTSWLSAQILHPIIDCMHGMIQTEAWRKSLGMLWNVSVSKQYKLCQIPTASCHFGWYLGSRVVQKTPTLEI